MKKFIITGFVVALYAAVGAVASAQSAPGWGTVKQMGGASFTSLRDNRVAGMSQDAAGNMYIAGQYAGTTSFDGLPAVSLGETDVFVAKYSPAGALLWLRQFKGTGVEAVQGFGVTPAGRCLLAGSYSGGTGDDMSFENTPLLVGSRIFGPNPNGRYSGLGFRAALTSSGNLEWSNGTYPSDLQLTSFAFDAQGNCYGTGQSGGDEEFSGQLYPQVGIRDAMLVKMNPATGAIDWARRVGDAGRFAVPSQLLVGASGAIYWHFNGITGTVRLDNHSVTFPAITGGGCLVKMTPNNRVRWMRNDLVTAAGNPSQWQPVAVDEAANAVYLQGYSLLNGTAITFPGSPVPPYVVPAGSLGTFVAVADTGGVAVRSIRPLTQSTYTGFQPPAADIVRLWATGNHWTYVANTRGDGTITYLPNGRPGNAAEGSLGVARLENAPSRLAWLRKAGVVGPAMTNNQSNVVGAVQDAAGNIWVAGTFAGTATFGTTTFRSNTSIVSDIFLAKLDMAVITGTRSPAAGRAWAVFPNPSPGAATLAGLPPQAQVRVYDAQGRLVRALGAVASAAAPRTLAGLAPGLYLLQVANTAEAYQLQRLVVE